MLKLSLAAAGVVSAAMVSVAGADALSQSVELGVRHLSLQELAPVQLREGGQTLLSLDLEGRAVVVELEPYSVRSDEFRVVLDFGQGRTEEAAMPAPTTVRGTVAGEPGSVVAGSLDGDGATLMVLSGGEWWGVQPVDGEGEGVHAVYAEGDLLDHGGRCGVPDNAQRPALPQRVQSMADRFANRGTGEFRVAEIALEADWRLFNTFFNQNETALVNDAESLLAALNVIYERDVFLTYQLTTVLIRTSPGADPYTSNDAGELLNQFQNEWNANQQDIVRDVAHLWTGRNIDGSTIGVAYLGTICTGAAYGVDQIRFTSNFNSRIGLFAHELGHNWDSEHCNGQGECRIMCSGLGGCNGLGNPVRFGPFAINSMNAFIPGRTCVDNIGVDLPVVEDFETASLDPLTWAGTVSFSIQNDGAAPSGNRVGRLIAPVSSMGTVPVDTRVGPGSGVEVLISARPETADPGALLRVSVRDGNNAQIRIGNIPATDPAQGYVTYSMQLPGVAVGIDSPLLITPTANGPTWRIDDVRVREATGTGAVLDLPFEDGFEFASLSFDRWDVSRGTVDTSAAFAGAYALGLADGQAAETASLRAAGESDVVFGARALAPADPGAELVLSYRNASGVWVEARRVASSSLPAGEWSIAEATLPADASHDALRVRFEAVGGVWRLDDVEAGLEARGTPDCPADLAAPFGVLDLQDISAFIDAFVTSAAAADLAAPFGVLDLADVNAFVGSFAAGCP